MLTYWLVGQDSFRQKLMGTVKVENTEGIPKRTTRSSLKQPKNVLDSNRVPAQESPKKLRFAPESPLHNNICDQSVQEGIQSSNSINNSSFQQDNTALISLSRLSLVSKRNSCPCLMQNCDFCCQSNGHDLSKTILPTKATDTILPELHSYQPGWGTVGKLASLVSCLEEKYVVVYNKLSNKDFVKYHSESEPFLPGINTKYAEDKGNKFDC